MAHAKSVSEIGRSRHHESSLSRRVTVGGRAEGRFFRPDAERGAVAGCQHARRVIGGRWSARIVYSCAAGGDEIERVFDIYRRPEVLRTGAPRYVLLAADSPAQ